MYPNSFHYHRARTLHEASTLMSQIGEGAALLAGGQSLIPLMKLRLAAPVHLVDLNFIPDLSYIREAVNDLRFGPLTRHADVARSSLAAEIPILVDCASGIADSQIRNRGTLAGSLAEADPSGDWAPVLLALDTRVFTTGLSGDKVFPLAEFITDAYTTELSPAEVIREIAVARPPEGSGGAYVAFKRSAQVYASASAAVHLTLEESDLCRDIRICLGAVGLTAIRAVDAEAELRGKPLNETVLDLACEAVHEAADPQTDRRGSVDYKKALAAHLTRRAFDAALRRARGERVEVSHLYA